MEGKCKTVELETERLILRKLKMEDAEEAFNNFGKDKQVSRYMLWATHRSIEDTKEWLKIEQKGYEEGKDFCWAIVLKDNNKLIGSIGMHIKEDEDNRYEIGYDIGVKYWNKGYVTEASKCVMDYLINKMNVKKFLGRHAKLNPASGAIIKKLGYRYIRDDFMESFDSTKLTETKVYYYDVYDNIQKAEEKDSYQIADIIREGWNTAYKGLIDNSFLKNMDKEKIAKWWSEGIKRSDNIYIYKEEGKTLGVIKYGINDDNIGEVYVLYIKPEEKRKGIGTKLLNFAKQELLKLRCTELIIWCLDGNTQGLNFYKKMGGKNIGKRNAEVNGLNVVEVGFKYSLNGNSSDDEIILARPTDEDELNAIKYKQEYFDNGEFTMHAAARWDKMDKYDEWLQFILKNAKKETVQKDWTVDSTFFGIRKSDKKIVGMIDIRHELINDFLRNYAGNIGYSVLPSERRKGYATQMLNKAMEYCKNYLKLDKIMIACHKENEGSRKTIVNAGGILEKEYQKDGENVQVYWIKL